MVLLVAITIGGGCYMLDYSLAPDPTREKTDSCYRQLFTDYPETREITQDKFLLSFYAWIRYKATAEVLGDADESMGEKR